jgi:hypothetical protein
MTTLEEMKLTEQLEQAKRLNARFDEITRDVLFPLIKTRFDGRTISNGNVKLKAHTIYGKAFDFVCLKIDLITLRAGGRPIPEWLLHAGTILFATRLLPSGKYKLSGSTEPGCPTFEVECESTDDLVATMESKLSYL